LLLAFGAQAMNAPIGERLNPDQAGPTYPIITNMQVLESGGDSVVRVTANGLPAVIALPGQDVNKLLASVGLTRSDFAKYNDLPVMLVNSLKPGGVYYLRPKEKKADVATHILQPKETVWDVAQKYAVRKDRLMKMNRLKSETVQPGTVLFLDRKRKKRQPADVLSVPDRDKAPDPWVATLRMVRPEPPRTAKEDNTALVTKPAAEGALATDGNNGNGNVNPNAKYHIVKENESLFNISQLYGVTILDLQKWNNLSNEEPKPGDVLIVNREENFNQPAAEGPAETAGGTAPVILGESANAGTNTAGNNNFNQPAVGGGAVNGNSAGTQGQQIAAGQNEFYHVVGPKETVYGIARQYNVPPRELMSWNGFNNTTKLNVGDRVLVKKAQPNPAVGTNNNTDFNKTASEGPLPNNTANTAGNAPAMGQPVTGSKSHSVKPNETLLSIAQQYQVSVEDLRKANNLPPDASLTPGKLLYIPSQASINSLSKPKTGSLAVADSARSDRFYALDSEPVRVAPVNTGTGTTMRPIYAAPSMNAILVTSEPRVDEGKLTASLQQSQIPGSTTTGGADGTNTTNPNFNATATDANANNANTAGGNTNYNTTAGANPNWNATAQGSNQSAATGNANNMAPKYHAIKKGETLYSISRKYGKTVEEVMQLNNLGNNNIKEGEQLLVGYGQVAPPTKPQPKQKVRKNTTASTVSVPRPTLNVNTKLPPNQLGTSFGVSNAAQPNSPYYELIESMNPVKQPATLIDGDGNTAYHKVQKGETLYRISQRYNISVKRIKQLNNLSDNNILVGTKLRIR